MRPEDLNKIQIDSGDLSEEMVAFLMRNPEPAALVIQAKKFQKEQGLVTDGWAGPATQGFIQRVVSAPPEPVEEVKEEPPPLEDPPEVEAKEEEAKDEESKDDSEDKPSKKKKKRGWS